MSHPLWSPDTDLASCVASAHTWDTENTLKTKQTMFSSCLTLFFHRNKNKKGTFLFLLAMSLCCLSNVLPPIVDTVFRLLMTLCPHNTSVNVIDLNSARIPSSSQTSVLCWQLFRLLIFISHSVAVSLLRLHFALVPLFSLLSNVPTPDSLKT